MTFQLCQLVRSYNHAELLCGLGKARFGNDAVVVSTALIESPSKHIHNAKLMDDTTLSPCALVDSHVEPPLLSR